MRDTSRPVPAASFPEAVRSGRAPAAGEYADLNRSDHDRHVSALSTDAGWANGKGRRGGGGGSMNRYTNVLPYDRNRVVLGSPVGGCDYVNASWVGGDGMDGGTRFIAAQGAAIDKT